MDDPLALAAGDLRPGARSSSRASRPTCSQRAPTPRPRRSAPRQRRRGSRSPSPTMLGHGQVGVERAQRVLEDELHARRCGASRAGAPRRAGRRSCTPSNLDPAPATGVTSPTIVAGRASSCPSRSRRSRRRSRPAGPRGRRRQRPGSPGQPRPSPRRPIDRESARPEGLEAVIGRPARRLGRRPVRSATSRAGADLDRTLPAPSRHAAAGHAGSASANRQPAMSAPTAGGWPGITSSSRRP